jgi:cardiolipin synthase
MTKQQIVKSLTFSTMLTLSRLIFIPFVVYAILIHWWSLALCLFVVAAITDILDGAFARLFDEQTTVGAYLDPIADKILLLSCYTSLSLSGLPSYIVPTWLVVGIFIKELILVIGALYFGLIARTVTIKATWVGKAAMFAQTACVFWLLLVLFAGRATFGPLLFVHQLVFVLVMASCVHYMSFIFKGTRLWYLLKRAF